MLKLLARILKKKPAGTSPARLVPPIDPLFAPIKEEYVPIYQSLAMTEEMREALFPTEPQMVSVIFERPAFSPRPAAAPPAPDGDGYPLI